jgi:hypothetical protein
LLSDTDVMSVTTGVTITRASEEHLSVLSPDDIFIDHIRLYRPQYLLWKMVDLSQEHVTSIAEFSRTLDADIWRGGAETDPAHLAYVEPVSQLLRAFQLFKPGRFVAGDTSFFVRHQKAGCNTLSLVRCSEMSIDYQFIQQSAPRFVFESSDAPFFLSFVERFSTAWRNVQKYPQLDLALHRYCKESAQYGDAIELMISLESLLVPEAEGIAFRLAQRVANLLGADAPSRKQLFKQIRDFYGLRSRIVHGAKIRSKEISAAQQIDALREITRRILLSVIALAIDVDLNADSYGLLLNELCFDDDLRRSVQAKASALLHC